MSYGERVWPEMVLKRQEKSADRCPSGVKRSDVVRGLQGAKIREESAPLFQEVVINVKITAIKPLLRAFINSRDPDFEAPNNRSLPFPVPGGCPWGGRTPKSPETA